MQKTFALLIRDSFVRPRDAARYLLSLNLPNNVLLQAAILRSVLSVLAWALMSMTMISMSTDVVLPEDIPPLINVILGLVGIILTSYIVVQFARLLGVKINLATSATVYIWFGLLESAMMIVILLAMYLFGSSMALLFIGAAFWGIWAMALFWSEVLGGKNVFVALPVIIGASLITVTLLGLLVGAFGLSYDESPQRTESSSNV